MTETATLAPVNLPYEGLFSSGVCLYVHNRLGRTSSCREGTFGEEAIEAPDVEGQTNPYRNVQFHTTVIVWEHWKPKVK